MNSMPCWPGPMIVMGRAGYIDMNTNDQAYEDQADTASHVLLDEPLEVIAVLSTFFLKFAMKPFEVQHVNISMARYAVRSAAFTAK